VKEVQTRKPPIIQTPLYERQKQLIAQREREHKRLVARILKTNKK
jgi:hypothetical protein